jgi:hypothetical protein
VKSILGNRLRNEDGQRVHPRVLSRFSLGDHLIEFERRFRVRARGQQAGPVLRPLFRVYRMALAAVARRGIPVCVNGMDRVRVHPSCLDLGLNAYEPEAYSSFTYALRPGQQVLEVGAGVGMFTIAAATRVGPTGRVIAVESDARRRSLLLRHVEWNGLQAVVTVREQDDRGLDRLCRDEALAPDVVKVPPEPRILKGMRALLGGPPRLVVLEGSAESPEEAFGSLRASGFTAHDAAGRGLEAVPGPGFLFFVSEGASPFPDPQSDRGSEKDPTRDRTRRSVPRKQQARVFVVSPGRSGSALIALALDVHPAITALHEPGDLAAMSRLAFEGWLRRVTSEDVDRALERRHRKLRPRGHGAWVESALWYTMLIPQLDGRFIHLIRDGREFVRSGLTRTWYTPKQSPVWRPHQLLPPPHLESRLGMMCWRWAEYQRRALEDLSRVPEGSQTRLHVGYGDIDWKGVVEGFLGLELSPEAETRMRAIERSRPNRALVKRPDWTDDMEETYQDLCGPVESLLVIPKA